MGTTKFISYPTKEKDIAAFAKAIGHPARVAILKKLFSKNKYTCGELVNEIDLSQSTISQHLKVLITGNIIIGRENGSKLYNHINHKN